MLSQLSNKICYVAALLEGEGYFGLVDKRYPTIKLTMTDLDIVQRIRNIIDSSINICTVNNDTINKKWSVAYSIQINGQLAAEWMMTLYVLMGVRRKERIREVLQVWRAYQSVSNAVRTERSVQSRRTNKMIKTIMAVRKISQEEAEKILEASLASIEKQTIN